MIRKIYRILLSALLALLGFTSGSCVAEYGMPNANYKAKGVVVSEEDNSPIQGIRAELKGYYTEIDTAHTDGMGSFSLKVWGDPSQKLDVELTDVDGEENGSFERMVIEADYTNKKFTGGSGKFYKGEAEIDLGTIKMKPAEPEKPE
jgi:putative lipoprotein (rSAM/lipoprotein system)